MIEQHPEPRDNGQAPEPIGLLLPHKEIVGEGARLDPLTFLRSERHRRRDLDHLAYSEVAFGKDAASSARRAPNLDAPMRRVARALSLAGSARNEPSCHHLARH